MRIPRAGEGETTDKGHAGGAVPLPCDRCGSVRARPVFRSEDHLTRDRFDLVRCEECGLLRTGLPGRGLDLSRYYGPGYYGDGGRRFTGIVERAIVLFRKARARAVTRYAESPGRILDIGCGRGLMLAALRASGWTCVGTEASESLAEATRRAHGFEVLSKDLEPLPFPDASFDAVTTWHSLEHLERPVRALKDIRRVLEPGGLLVIEVPNAASLQARLGGGSWFHLDAPRHLYHFSRMEMTGILAGLDFVILREGTFSLEYGPFGMAQSLLNRVTFHPNVLYGILKRTGTAREGKRTGLQRVAAAWDLLATIVLALPAGAAGTALEVLAGLAGRGGVVRIMARKGPREGRVRT